MNDRDDDRLVDDFFAAHRRRVVSHDADERTWDEISARGGQGRGRSAGLWFLGGAAAASAVAVAVLVSQNGVDPSTAPAAPGDGGAVVTTDAPTVAPSPDTTDAPKGTTAATEGPRAEEPATAGTGPETPVQPAPEAPTTFTLPVPDLSAGIFLVEEPTGDQDSLRTAVYQLQCEALSTEWACPGLAVSEDGGESWTATVDMSAAGYSGAVSARESTWMWGAGTVRDDVPEVRAGLVRSDDAGRTWTDVSTRGEGVLFVEAFRSTLVVVTDGCEDGPAGTCQEVVITDVTADDATSGRRLITLDGPTSAWWAAPGPLPEGALQATYDAVYLTMPTQGAVFRIADGEEVATRIERPGCLTNAAPESPDSLVSWCAGSTTVEVSTDGGTTWEERSGFGGTEVVGVASNDGQRLAVATDDGLWTGTDDVWERALDWPGGRTRLDALAGQSMRFGGWFRFLADADPESYQRWTTDDDGRTWTEQPPPEITAIVGP